MEKYLVTIEFRYSEAPTDSSGSTFRSKIVSIKFCQTFEEACIEGNKLLEKLESKFPLHIFPNGREAAKERFSKNGGCFGYKKDLVSNMAYLQTPFTFYAKIETLKFYDVETAIDEVIAAVKGYQDYQKTTMDQ